MESLSQNAVFFLFLIPMILIAAFIFIVNEREVKKRRSAHEADILASRRRMAAIEDADNMTAFDMLIHIHRITGDAIARLEQER